MSRYLNPDSELNIRRIDSPKVHGFQFHVKRQALKITRLFSDSVAGGKEQARESARAFRDTIVPKLPDPLYAQSTGAARDNSRTKILGVSISEYPNADGTSRLYVQTTARNPITNQSVNKRIRISAIDELGDAIQLLREWRDGLARGSKQ